MTVLLASRLFLLFHHVYTQNGKMLHLHGTGRNLGHRTKVGDPFIAFHVLFTFQLFNLSTFQLLIPE